MVKVGDRVGAVQKADENTVYFYGYGEYIGDTIPSRGILGDAGIKNPTIKLDNGQVVYGFECWWGDEERIKKWIGDRTVIMINI